MGATIRIGENEGNVTDQQYNKRNEQYIECGGEFRKRRKIGREGDEKRRKMTWKEQRGAGYGIQKKTMRRTKKLRKEQRWKRKMNEIVEIQEMYRKGKRWVEERAGTEEEMLEKMKEMDEAIEKVRERRGRIRRKQEGGHRRGGNENNSVHSRRGRKEGKGVYRCDSYGDDREETGKGAGRLRSM